MTDLKPYISTAATQFAPGNFVTTWNPELGREARAARHGPRGRRAMTTEFHKAADEQGIPLRTLADVKNALNDAALVGTDHAMARLMLRHGRLTDGARKYVEREYPQ